MRQGLGRAILGGMLLLVPACGGGEAATTTTAAPTTTATTAPSTTTTVSGAEITLTLVPGPGVTVAAWQVEAGRDFEVAWTGPNAAGDYVTIVPSGAAVGAYDSYFDTATGATGRLVAPVDPGEYEVRYVDGGTSETRLAQPLTVVAATVGLEAPSEVGAGTVFEVSWVGPDGPGDYVTIVPAGAAEGVYESYFDTSTGSTGSLVAPLEDGDYEVRYVNGSESATLAAVAVTVTPLAVTLVAPPEVDAGAEFQVTWTGPDGPSDYVTIVPAGAPDSAYLDYAYTTEGNPLTLTAPDEPGDYEVRYASDRVDPVFATIPIVVK